MSNQEQMDWPDIRNKQTQRQTDREAFLNNREKSIAKTQISIIWTRSKHRPRSK